MDSGIVILMALNVTALVLMILLSAEILRLYRDFDQLQASFQQMRRDAEEKLRKEEEKKVDAGIFKKK